MEELETKQEEMTLEDKIIAIHKMNEIVKVHEGIVEESNKTIKELQPKIDALKAEVLKEMQDKNQKEFVVDGIYANVCTNTSTGYTDEAQVLKYLQDNKYDNFIKTTLAIKKKELNAELKNNPALKKDIDSFITTKYTSYVTVTNEENHTKMLEHINESKKGK